MQKLSFIEKKIIKLYDKSNLMLIMIVISFLEGFISPIPPDIMFFPLVLRKKYKLLTIAAVCCIVSVLGGVVGYIIGYYFYELLGQKIIVFFNLQSLLITAKNIFSHYGYAFVIFSAISPFPYKLIAISSGLFSYNFLLFVLFSIIGRGFRFLVVLYLIKIYRKKLLSIVQRYTKYKRIFWIGCLLIVITFIIYWKWL